MSANAGRGCLCGLRLATCRCARRRGGFVRRDELGIALDAVHGLPDEVNVVHGREAVRRQRCLNVRVERDACCIVACVDRFRRLRAPPPRSRTCVLSASPGVSRSWFAWGGAGQECPRGLQTLS